MNVVFFRISYFEWHRTHRTGKCWQNHHLWLNGPFKCKGQRGKWKWCILTHIYKWRSGKTEVQYVAVLETGLLSGVRMKLLSPEQTSNISCRRFNHLIFFNTHTVMAAHGLLLYNSALPSEPLRDTEEGTSACCTCPESQWSERELADIPAFPSACVWMRRNPRTETAHLYI